MEVAGPLGTPLGLAQRKRASPRGEAGTSGFLCVSDLNLSKLAHEMEALGTGSLVAGAMLVPKGKMPSPLCFSLIEVTIPSCLTLS